MHDIETRSDIEDLVMDFYQKAVHDRVIGDLFDEAAKIDLESHLPVIADFWEAILFGNSEPRDNERRGEPGQTHAELDEKKNLKLEHFARWVRIFAETVDAKFSGQTANLAKIRAFSIANTMRLKFSAKTAEDVPVHH